METQHVGPHTPTELSLYPLSPSLFPLPHFSPSPFLPSLSLSPVRKRLLSWELVDKSYFLGRWKDEWTFFKTFLIFDFAKSFQSRSIQKSVVTFQVWPSSLASSDCWSAALLLLNCEIKTDYENDDDDKNDVDDDDGDDTITSWKSFGASKRAPSKASETKVTFSERNFVESVFERSQCQSVTQANVDSCTQRGEGGNGEQKKSPSI